ncbi:hypothetical protein [Dermatobacter hominis]|uniref:hypothetical protein n=1 Tax=Dermatobacter hominis TaxID=2884263 RepID=UPI001D128B9B|nr:hypothetical protein [Dermatobacter hominis]UDY37047.1 hypothetical protein LH044_05795 [Dermatobacter hominis]
MKIRQLSVVVAVIAAASALVGCTQQPPPRPTDPEPTYTTIVFDSLPGLCFGNAAVVDGVEAQVCQSSYGLDAFVVARAAVPGQDGCQYAAPTIVGTATQNGTTVALSAIDEDPADPFVERYDTGFDVGDGAITVEIRETSHGPISSCDVP